MPHLGRDAGLLYERARHILVDALKIDLLLIVTAQPGARLLARNGEEHELDLALSPIHGSQQAIDPIPWITKDDPDAPCVQPFPEKITNRARHGHILQVDLGTER